MTKDQNKLDGWRERFIELDKKYGLVDVGDGTELDKKMAIFFNYFTQERQTLIEWVEENVIGKDEEIEPDYYEFIPEEITRNELKAEMRKKLLEVKE